MEFQVPSRHTPEMIRHELSSMLGIGEITLCLGHLMTLVLLRSPYIYGGEVDADRIGEAKHILGCMDMDNGAFHEALLAEMDAVFRPLELFDDDNKPEDESKKSVIAPFSPEWMCDILRSACQAVPAIGIEDALWRVPLVLIMHLGVAESRAQGATTRRPVDYTEALKRFKEMRKQEN